MPELGEGIMVLLAFAGMIAVGRFGYVIADAAAKRVLVRMWPPRKLLFETGSDDNGRAYRWLRDDYGRVMYIERRPDLDREESA